MRRLLTCFVALTLFACAVFADEGHKHQPMAGEKLGNVHFPISCGAASQKEFDRGMAMLHSFWSIVSALA